MSSGLCTIVGMGPGLSASIARRFGREGYAVAALARRAPELDALVADLRRSGMQAWGYAADCADPAALRAALDRVQAEHGTTDVLVYNAAQLMAAEPLALEPTQLSLQFSVNVVGALVAAQAVAPTMIARGAGSILITGGSLALRPWSAFTGLSVGKAGLRALVHCLAQQLQPQGIHVAQVLVCGLVAPGSDFDPDRIAETYLDLHRDPPGRFRVEVAYRGAAVPAQLLAAPALPPLG